MSIPGLDSSFTNHTVTNVGVNKADKKDSEVFVVDRDGNVKIVKATDRKTSGVKDAHLSEVAKTMKDHLDKSQKSGGFKEIGVVGEHLSKNVNALNEKIKKWNQLRDERWGETGTLGRRIADALFGTTKIKEIELKDYNITDVNIERARGPQQTALRERANTMLQSGRLSPKDREEYRAIGDKLGIMGGDYNKKEQAKIYLNLLQWTSQNTADAEEFYTVLERYKDNNFDSLKMEEDFFAPIVLKKLDELMLDYMKLKPDNPTDRATAKEYDKRFELLRSFSLEMSDPADRNQRLEMIRLNQKRFV